MSLWPEGKRVRASCELISVYATRPFKTIKSEMLWRTAFLTRQEVKKALGLYNPTRRHSALDYQSPITFERQRRKIETEALHFY
ncbi:IS3 family transposase [Polycladidibacter stylochi]|uniref:IS3 family transposase n=1 Tax=Polycladidibacter stylochi TaxID=1807766 RepID=UPI003B75B801